MKKALLFGASGMVGSYLLEYLLQNPAYEKVTIVVRKDIGIKHPNLTTLIGDLNNLPSLKDKIQADDVFISLGTTKAKTPDEKEYYKIDHDYPVEAARIAKEQGATAVFLVSAVGPDANSGMFYIRTKGETERDVLALDYAHTHIFRPSMIMGNRQEKRSMEKVFIALFALINPLLFNSRFRGIQAGDIARAMNNAAQKPAGKVQVYHWKEMKKALI